MIDQAKFRKVLLDSLQYPDAPYGQYGQRAIADILEAKANEVLNRYFDTKPASSRRSIEDITVDGCYVDHKTTDGALKFKMPNLISVDRLWNLERPLYYNFIIYDSSYKKVIDCMLLNVYQLNWDNLTIGNLGAGQLQISNMQKFLDNPKSDMTESEWREMLRSKMISFYSKLINKTQNRLDKIIHK
jgi:hypothetical protein